MLACAPAVVSRHQKIDSTSAGKVRARRNRERQPHHVGDVLPLERDAQHDRQHGQDDRGPLRDEQLLAFVGMAPPNDVHPEVVRERRGARQRQPGHHGENRRERHGGDEPQERRTADAFGEQRRRHVAAGVEAS